MIDRRVVAYWVATLWLSVGMLASAVLQLVRMPEVLQSFGRLGYPRYLLVLLGVWKILGVIVLIAPRMPLLKEWAYAGFFFVASGALFSHIAIGDGFVTMLPTAVLLVLTAVSWYLRPESRRLAGASRSSN
ncbi:MAG TPA: DoxX family protein [Pyrinomonadaceae bacterium]|nr:DoxX family protein [Pyrinomonadaceae bacterium]